MGDGADMVEVELGERHPQPHFTARDLARQSPCADQQDRLLVPWRYMAAVGVLSKGGRDEEWIGGVWRLGVERSRTVAQRHSEGKVNLSLYSNKSTLEWRHASRYGREHAAVLVDLWGCARARHGGRAAALVPLRK
jgi:hypothetical protein